MVSLGMQLASLVVVALLVGCLIAWAYALAGWLRGRPLLVAEPRPRPTWQFAEILLCFGLYMMLLFAFQGALQRSAAPTAVTAAAAQLQSPVAPNPPPHVAPADQPLSRQALGLAITADGIAKVFAIAGVLLWMTMLDRRAAERLGLRLTARDVKIGLVASAMLLPPILAVQALLTQFVQYQHPVLDVIRDGPGLWLGLAMVVNTVAIAPVAEEFFFRGLFQGWLQRWGGRTDAPHAAVIDAPQRDLDTTLDPYRPLVPLAEAPPQLISGQQVAAWPWWPVVVSSALFAVVHLGQGAAPLSLFLLALGLGYLYRQTGRLAAPIIVHMILNGLSTAITFLTAAAEAGTS